MKMGIQNKHDAEGFVWVSYSEGMTAKGSVTLLRDAGLGSRETMSQQYGKPNKLNKRNKPKKRMYLWIKPVKM